MEKKTNYFTALSLKMPFCGWVGWGVGVGDQSDDWEV